MLMSTSHGPSKTTVISHSAGGREVQFLYAYTYLDHRNDLNNIILISLKFQIWKIEYKILLVKFF